MASNDDILLKKPKRQGILVEEYLRGVDIQEQLPPATPVAQPPPAVPQIPPEMTYLNTPQGQAFVQKALLAPESLTQEEQQQWTATVNVVPELQQLQQQYQAQAEQAKGEAAQAGPEWLNKGEREILGRFAEAHKIFGGLPHGLGAVPYGKLAADVLSEMFLPAVKTMEEMSADIPWPISPHKDRSTLTNAEIAQDRRWNKLSAADKALYLGQKVSVGAVKGALGFVTQQADILINPEKYNMTPQEAVNETADGLADMMANAPDQVGYIAEVMFGTPNNPITKLAEAAGTIANLPKIAAGEKRAMIREEAINTLYEAPESLPFALMIGRGAWKAMKEKIPIRVGEKPKAAELPEGFKVAEEVPKKAAEKPGEPVPKETAPEAKGAKTIELEPVEVAKPEVPEVIATKSEMADASRNLAHTKRYIKETEEFLKRDDIPEALRKEIQPQLKQARLDEAGYQAAFDKLQKAAEPSVKKRKVTAPEEKPIIPKELEPIETPAVPKAVGVQHIRKHLQAGVDVPIRTGRTGKAAGTFKVKPRVIRLQSWDDVGSLTHEIAHALEESPQLSKLWKASDELGKLDYEPLKARKNEGFAEYMRHYMTGSADVAQLAPKFTEAFEAHLRANPELGAYIQHGRNLIRKYAEEGATERIWQQIDYQDRGEKAPIGERIGRGLRRLGTLFEDDIRPIEYAEKQIRGAKDIDPRKIDPAKSPTQLARFVARTANAKARSMVLDGMFDFSGKQTGMSLRTALEPVNKKMKDFTKYAYSKHALDSWKRGIDPGIDLADAKYTFDKFDNPTFRSAADAVNRWQDGVLQYAIDSGVLSKESAAAMKALNPSYIPLKRVFEKGQHVSINNRTLADVTKPFKRRAGSGRRIRNPWHAMIEGTAQIINAADRTRVGKALVELAEETKGAGQWIEKVEAPKQAVSASVKSMKKALEDAGVDLSEADMGQIITVYSNAPKYFGRENIVSFWKDGKRQFYEVHPDLFASLKSVDDLQMKAWMKILGAPARSIRLGATGLQAGFGLITNPLRDAFGFALQSEWSRGTPELIAKGLYKKLQPKDQMHALFKRAGADMSQYLGPDRNSLKMAMDEVMSTTSLRKAYNVARHPIEVTKEILSVTEAAPRLAEFEAAYLQGEKLYGKGSVQAQIIARNAAADVTVNFGRMGVYGRAINQIIPFWNAQVQGLSKFIRFANAHPTKAGIKAVGSLTIPTIAIWLANKDEQWYKDMKPWEKYGFWNFEVGQERDGSPRILKIPRPFEWGIAFSAMPEMTLNYWEQKDPAIIKDGLGHMYDQAIPDFMPPIVKIPMELAANYDYFRDRQIDPTFEVMYLDPEQRFSPYQTETAKFIARQFGVSPRKVEHLVGGATGGLGMDIIKAAEQGFDYGEDKDTPSDWPVVGRLFARTQTEQKREERLEQQRKQVQAKVNKQFNIGNDERGQEIAEQWNKQHPEYSVSY